MLGKLVKKARALWRVGLRVRRALARKLGSFQRPSNNPKDAILLALPPELLEEVFLHLDPASLCCVASSCKLIRASSNSDIVWRQVFDRRFPGLSELLDTSNPRWWRHNTWKERYRRLRQGAKFSAQVYNREVDNTAEDFLLSAYDAVVCLERRCRNEGSLFSAKYLPMAKERVTEKNISVNRLRSAPKKTNAYTLFQEVPKTIQVGDEVEVQWRGLETHPWGWWYGFVESVCTDKVVLLFEQYPPSSAWRTVGVSLRPAEGTHPAWDHRYGYIGGVRKLNEREMQEWKGVKDSLKRMLPMSTASSPSSTA